MRFEKCLLLMKTIENAFFQRQICGGRMLVIGQPNHILTHPIATNTAATG